MPADIPASTWSQTDASNTTASPDGAPENMAPSGVNDTIRMMMGAVKRWFAWSIPATTAGTTTAYTLTYSVAPAALVDGMTHLVLFNATNGSSATLNVNSLGAKALHTYQNGAWAAAVAGTLTANMVCQVAYNSGDNSYRVLSYGVGAAFLAVANTFTGNNTYTGSNNFTGGTITVPTATVGDNDTSAASTAFVQAAITNQIGGTVIRSYLAGLALSAAGGTATFGIAAGVAADGGNAAMMPLGSAYTKTTSAWAVGTGNGALDTGAIANSTWYHVWLIKRSDTGVVDVLVSTSASSPTMPTNYDLKRRIGSMKTDGSAQWVKFIQSGDLFQWGALVADVADTNPGTSLVTKTLTVPTGVNVLAEIIVDPVFATTGGAKLYIHDLSVSDEAASTANGFVNSTSSPAGQTGGWRGDIRTNTSGQIGYRLSGSGASDVINITTAGWRDTRGRDA